MKKFIVGKHIIVFYQEEGDKKFSFLIENEPELTKMLLNSVRTKRIKGDGMTYALLGLSRVIEELEAGKIVEPQELPENPMIVLAEFYQKQYGKDILSKVIDVYGSADRQVIEVEIDCPDGGIFRAHASNQRIARRIAAEKALRQLNLL